ncbi:MAG TPA: immunoglobulin domain-containing protein [Verrucomicrobiota bacterium]|nr:immunoglobulin domain-containing protein [Verrucomicrobiota bacterium]HNU49494.1 immunoglobulin domain-containing protein [Verrucomicrobiota bacterium]
MSNPLTSALGRPAAWCAALAAACGLQVLAQTIPNPSFEENSFGTWPGYISGNTAIAGWTGTPDTRVGLNPAGGSPFADNGTIPAGNNVAFIQANVDDPFTPATLSTTISGLTVGTTYKVTFRANARTGATQTPFIKVYIDGAAVLLPSGAEGISIAPVGGSNPYWTVAFEFAATAASQQLSIVNDAEGDHTLLVDDFKIGPSNGRWTAEQWTYDADSGVDETLALYTHAYNFATGEGTVINGVPFIGIPGTSPGAQGLYGFSTTYLNYIYNNDGNNLTLNGDGGSVLARDFVYSAAVPASLYQSITIKGLTPGTEYIATIFTVGWEDPSIANRWATFTAGEDSLTLNQDMFYNDGGLKISYRYVADATGTVTLKYAPLVPNNLSIHTYGFCNREAAARNQTPIFVVQPQSAIVSPDVPVTFSAATIAFPTATTYQWRLNGAPIAGATDATYAIAAVSSADAGTYDVVASNAAGSTTSAAATLTVGIPMVNASFEIDTFPTWPGYVSGAGNWPITGWASEGGHGVNPVEDGTAPFADNGRIPNGTHVAFLQAAGSMNQTVTGLTPGGQYYVHYQENARGGATLPAVEVQVDGATVVPAHLVTQVGGSNPYHSMGSDVFTAGSDSVLLAFIKTQPQGGDCTALIDNVAILPVPAGTAPSISTQPANVSAYVGEPASFRVIAQGSLPMTYQWQLNGTPIDGATGPGYNIDAIRLADSGDYTVVISNAAGTVTSNPAKLAILEPIYSLHNTGIGADGAPAAAGTVSPYWTLIQNPDGGAADAFVANDGWPIAAGVWMVNDATSKWIGSRAAVGESIPVGMFVYRTAFDLTGRDISTVSITARWASDDGGQAVFVNGRTVSVALSGGFTGWTSFTLNKDNATFVEGVNTIDFALNNGGVGPTGIRVEFTKTAAVTLPGIAPAITVGPRGGEAVEGSTVTLTVSASGTLPLAFQWRKNGVDLPGQTGEILTLTAVTGADSGNYSVKVSNPWGDAVSADAYVNVNLRPIPGIFGTGVGPTGALLGDGAVDPHYTIIESADFNFPGPDAIVVTNAWPIVAGTWALNGPSSCWISATGDQRADVTPEKSGVWDGNYTFRTTFDLTGYDLSKVRLSGGWAVDNGGVDIIVNGINSGIVNNNGFAYLTAFTLTEAMGIVAGPNEVDFVVYNAVDATWGINPMGLRVDLVGYQVLDTVQQPTMAVASQNGSITVTWSPTDPAQELHSATSITGPWTKIEGATSGYSTPSTTGTRFFKVVKP